VKDTPEQQINMITLNCSESLSVASLEKLQTGFTACLIVESRPASKASIVHCYINESDIWGLDSRSDASFYDSETDAASQQSYDCNPLTKVRTWSKPLGGGWAGEKIITLTPCSTAPSSPESEVNEAHSFIDKPEESQQQPPTDELLDVPSVQGMIKSLRILAVTKSSFIHIRKVEEALLTHLHTNPVTLADVQTLIPYLSFGNRITNKLATNISLHHARGAISESVVEDMLIHMLNHNSALMAHTRDQISRFQHEREQRQLHYLSEKQRRLCFQDERERRKQQAKKEDENTLRCRCVVPAQCCEKSDFAPYDCGSVVGIVAEDGLSWKKVQQVQRYARMAQVEVDMKFFSQTRLHNGPGLTDKKLPKVRLPSVCRTGVEKVL
jgi:hypothetical protein